MIEALELSRSRVLQRLPQEELKLVAACSKVFAFRFGATVVREGDPADAYFLIRKGRLRVVRMVDGEERTLRRLQPGDGFGEMALLKGGTRTATVRATSDVELLCLARSDFHQILERSPSLEGILHSQMERRELSNLLACLGQFSGVTDTVLEQLVQQLEPRLLSAGEVLVADGDAADGLYVIEEGYLRVRNSLEERYLRAGDFLAERSALTGKPFAGHAEAICATRVLRLPAAGLKALQQADPALAEVLKGREQATGSYDAVPLDVSLSERPQAPSRKRLGRADGSTTGWSMLFSWSFPFVWQLDGNDCGAAALTMACRRLGYAVSLAQVRERTGTTLDGVGLQDLALAAVELGVSAHPARVDGEELANCPQPSLIHLSRGHWSVLIRSGKRRVTLADPEVGFVTMPRAKLAEQCSGYVLLLDAPEATEPIARLPGKWSWVWPLAEEHILRLALVGLLTLALCALQVSFPVLTQQVFDHVLLAPSERSDSILQSKMMLLSGALTLLLVLTLIQRALLSRLLTRLDGTVMDFLLDRMLGLRMSYFARRTADALRRRLESARAVRQFLVHGSVTSVLAAVQLLVLFAALAWYSWKLAVLALVVIPIYLGVMLASGRVLQRSFRTLDESESSYRALEEDVIEGIDTVKSNAAESAFRRRMMGAYHSITAGQRESGFNLQVYDGVGQALALITTLLLLWFGAITVLHDELQVGAFIAALMLFGMSCAHFQSLMNGWRDLQLSRVLMDRLHEIIAGAPEVDEDSPLQPVPSVAGGIRLERLSFFYGSKHSAPVLQDISLRVSPGETIAIVGRSGAGKSTLARCLAGLEPPTDGVLYVDEVDAAQLNPQQLRQHIGFVPQRNHLFQGSILQNIAFGDPHPDRERAMAAAKAANADAFIKRLPAGLDSEIERVEPFLSAGQRQMLGIARAVYRAPQVVVLDEATSGIDIESARVVRCTLADFLADRTAFVVAHDLPTIQLADRILVLEEGRAVEIGTHQELLARQGLYYHLFQEILRDR